MYVPVNTHISLKARTYTAYTGVWIILTVRDVVSCMYSRARGHQYNNCSRSSYIQLSRREQTDYNNNILPDLLHSIFGDSTHWLAEQEPPQYSKLNL